MRFTARNEQETIQLGTALAGALETGTVVALVGDLGAGKTRLVQAVAEALGVDRRDVTSPTFILIQEYDGRLPLYHIDTYRLRDEEEFLALGASELMESEGVCFIEWADKVADVLPEDLLRIEIAATGAETREFEITARGERPKRVLARLKQPLREVNEL